MAVVDELITLLGLEADPGAAGEAKGFENLLGGVRKASLAAGTALVALTGASFAMAKQFAGTADESGKFAESVGINLKKLEELEFATKRVGGSSADLRSDLDGLASKFGSANTGIDAMIVAFDGLSDQEAKLAGASYGISESTIRLLREGADGIADLRAEFRALGGGLPDDAAEKAAEFNDQWTNLTTTISGIAGVVQVALLPAFSNATQSLREFLVNNRELISSGLETFIVGVQKGFSAFGDIIDRVVEFMEPMLSRISEMTEGLEFVDIIANLVTGALAAFAVVLAPMAVQLLAIGAAAVLVGIAIDDLITFFQGGDSVIGRFFDAFEKRFPALAKMAKFVGGVFKDMFSLIIDGWKMIGQAIADILPDLGGFAEEALDLLNAGAELLGFGEDGSDGRDGRDGVRGEGGGSGQNGRDGTSGRARTSAPDTRVSQPVAQIPASIVNNAQTNNQGGTVTNTFNINGTGDPRGVASEVVRRGSLGAAVQTVSPGQRAPRVS